MRSQKKLVEKLIHANIDAAFNTSNLQEMNEKSRLLLDYMQLMYEFYQNPWQREESAFWITGYLNDQIEEVAPRENIGHYIKELGVLVASTAFGYFVPAQKNLLRAIAVGFGATKVSHEIFEVLDEAKPRFNQRVVYRALENKGIEERVIEYFTIN